LNKPSKHSKSEEPKKKKPYNRWDIALVVIVLLLGLLGYRLFTQPSGPITTTSTSLAASTSFLPITATNYRTLGLSDFNLTHSPGCLRTDPKTRWLVEHFVVTVYNRYKEATVYFNASVYVANIAWADGSFTFDSLKSILEFQGPIYNQTIKFTVDFPISGTAYGQSYASTQVATGLFGVFVGVEQNAPPLVYPAEPNIAVSSLASACSG
jgi:hypothetical protein